MTAVRQVVAGASERPRAVVLDGLRGLAILLVLVHHFFRGFAPSDGLVDRAVFAAASRAWMGVDLFFVLSGYLITGILIEQRGRPHYYRNFYARRTLRIFPLYYAVLAVVFLLAPRLGPGPLAYVSKSAPDQAWFWGYLTNVRIAWRDAWYPQLIPNVLWSLAIEEQFYLLWPLVVAACGNRRLAGVSIALAFLALALRVGLALAPGNHWLAGLVLTPTRADGLALGALVALLAREPGWLARRRRAAGLVGIVALVGYGWLTVQRGPGWEGTPLQALRFTAVAAGFSALLVLVLGADRAASEQRPLLVRLASMHGLLVLGKYSYALYLLHGPVDAIVKAHWGALADLRVLGSTLPMMGLYVLAAGGLTLLLARLSWMLLEAPCLRLKRYFPSS